jgi:hypothetical protein
MLRVATVPCAVTHPAVTLAGFENTHAHPIHVTFPGRTVSRKPLGSTPVSAEALTPFSRRYMGDVLEFKRADSGNGTSVCVIRSATSGFRPATVMGDNCDGAQEWMLLKCQGGYGDRPSNMA